LQGFSTKTDAFLNILADDFNIPNAVTYVLDLVKEGNNLLRSKESTKEQILDLYHGLDYCLKILGIEFNCKIFNDEDKELFNAYNEAKANKNFEESDRIRKILIEKGIF